MKKKRAIFTAILLSLLASSLLLAGCETNPVDPAASTLQTVQPQAKASGNLMEGITPHTVDTKTPLSDPFILATSDFSIHLLQKNFTEKENTLLSPLSVSLALGMTANGTDGNTQSQFLQILGNKKLTQPQLNAQYAALSKHLAAEEDKGVLAIANSIWYDNQFGVTRDFLQTNADYFQAGAFQLDFQAPETLERINGWVKEHTDGNIEKIIEKIDPSTVMYLINAVYFEMEWKEQLFPADTIEQPFHTQDGKTVSTPFMVSGEQYLESETAHGIKKPYADDRYSFVAILPKNGVSLPAYIQSLTGQAWLDLMQSDPQIWAEMRLPKFQYDFSASLKEPLKNMGLTDGFSEEANFAKMTSDPVYIADVLHKTFIEVNEKGTKAGAATAVEIRLESAFTSEKQVTFDHPFLYGIIDNETGLPLFLGAVMNPAG